MKNYFSVFKRGLSLVLAMVLCLSLLSPVASAASEDEHDHGFETYAATDDQTTCTHPKYTYHVSGWLETGILGYDVCDSCGAWRWNLWWHTSPRDWMTDNSTPGSGEKPDTSCKHDRTEYRPNDNSATHYEQCLICKDKVRSSIPCTPDPAKTTSTGDACTGITTTYTCSVCGGTYTETTQGQHTPGEAVRENETDATCGAAGSYDEVVYCTVCKTELSRETKTISATDDHSWDAGVVTTEPTCEKAGVKTFTCTVCGATKTEEVSANGHAYGDWTVVTAPTEEAVGKAQRVCANDSTHVESMVLPKLPSAGATEEDEWTLSDTKEPTCTEEGYFEYKHSGTGLTFQIAIPATGHNYATEWSSDNTNHWYECSNCGDKKDAAAHTFGDPKYIFTDGRLGQGKLETVSTCTVCGYEKRETVASSNVSEKVFKPTCEEYGKTVYSWKVRVGNKWETKSVDVIDWTKQPLGHRSVDDVDWIQDSGYYGKPGEHVKVCGRKNENYNTTCKYVLAHEEHTIEERVLTAPTCEKAGSTTKQCTVCNARLGGKVLPATGHDFSKERVVWDWSRATSVTATFTCGNDASHTKTVDATVKYEIVEEPNCITKGSAVYTATATFEEDGETITAIGEKTAELAPNGKHHFNEDGICEICGYVNPDGHTCVADKENGVVVEATCTTPGLTKYKCLYCEEIVETVVTELALGHDYVGEVTIPATCTAKGEMAYTCDRCDVAYTEELPMVAHTRTFVDEIPATCEGNGMAAHYVCSECGELSIGKGTKYETVTEAELVIEATGHTEVIDAAVAATCTETGLTEGSHCSVCSKVLTAQEVIPATGHSFGEWAVTTAPTATEDGEAARTCSECGELETMPLPAFGEGSEIPEGEVVWTVSVERTAEPTCTAAGADSYTYTAVKDEEEVFSYTFEVALAALGHSYSAAWTASADDHWHVCTRCGAASGNAAHTWDGGVVTRYATYTSTGERTYTCTVCSATRAETIPMLPYTPGPIGPVGPTDPTGGNEGGNGGTGEIDIDDNETPLGDGEDMGEEIDIDDNETPLASGLNLGRVAYLAGYEDNTVRPANRITRAEVATVFYRLMSDLLRELNWSDTNSFTDVNADNWFNEAVSTAANAGILRGYGDSSFKPNNDITRAEFATIASRFLSVEVESAAVFTDVSGHWAEEAIGIVAGAGWIKGYEDGTFRPDETITRAEAAIIINRMLGRDIADREDDTRSWIDNPLTAWFYQDIQEATNGTLLR